MHNLVFHFNCSSINLKKWNRRRIILSLLWLWYRGLHRLFHIISKRALLIYNSRASIVNIKISNFHLAVIANHSCHRHVYRKSLWRRIHKWYTLLQINTTTWSRGLIWYIRKHRFIRQQRHNYCLQLVAQIVFWRILRLVDKNKIRLSKVHQIANFS